jgi:predicted RecA/RadA family phage recombinase
MRNFIANGEKLNITAAAAIVSGQGVLVGGIFGVAEADAAVGQTAVINLVGTYSLPKAPSQAWTVGQVIYWDAANSRTTNVLTGNTRIGIAAAPVGGGAGETVGQVRLNGAAT